MPGRWEHVRIGPMKQFRKRALQAIAVGSLLCLGLILGFAVLEALSADFDPQSIVGDWQGDLINHSSPWFSNRYNLTISVVDGEKVYGHMSWPNQGAMPAASNGNALTVRMPDGSLYNLTVFDQRMIGFVHFPKGFPHDIRLTKVRAETKDSSMTGK